jgi:hypothetical protein
MDKQIVLPGLYALQMDIENDPARFKVIACGRRWGKTFFAMRQLFKTMMLRYLETGRRQRGWVVAPTFPLVREDWLTAEHVLKDAIVSKHQTEMRMDFGKIGFAEFKSADRGPDGLIGAGIDIAILDETSRISKESWENGVRPTLGDKQGKAIFISTPKGRNWFYDIYLKGKEGRDGFKSWQHPTFSNPYFPKSEWEIIKNTTPEMILKQEYEADFLEDEATVFKNISKCIRGKLEDPIPNEYYTIGIDLGRTEDFTVITVVRNSTASVVAIYRTNKIDWAIQKDFIKSVCSRYKKHLAFIDSTGLGDPIEDDLRRGGVNTKAFKFTQESKQELVEQLIVAIEQGLIGIPNCKDTEFLIDELKSFSYEMLPSGRFRYEAPSGLHDDGVMSLGLAIRGISHLLYKKAPVAPKPKRTMQMWTANEWDEFYSQIDKACKDNPFQTREQAIEGLKRQRYISMLERHS